METCLPIIEQLASDTMFYVRKEAAAAIGNLALVLDTELVEQRLVIKADGVVCLLIHCPIAPTVSSILRGSNLACTQIMCTSTSFSLQRTIRSSQD